MVLWQPRWLVTALAKRSPEVVYYVETTEPVVALTIDDGPDRETTPGILRTLAAHGARATFFLLSDRVPGNEDVVLEIVAQGHELGNHLTRDERHIDLPTSEFEAVLLEAHAVLSRFGSLRWVRPGAGWYDDSMLAVVRAHGYRVALGSIYPYDAQIPFTAFAVPHVLRNLRPGSVLVLHDGGARGRRTISLLQRVLPEIQRRGYQVVTLSELAR